MPARSFVDKWGGDANALREADQVAWNIASLGTYSSNLENSGVNKQDWPDAYNLVFLKALNAATPDSKNNVSSTVSLVTEPAGRQPDPGLLGPEPLSAGWQAQRQGHHALQRASPA